MAKPRSDKTKSVRLTGRGPFSLEGVVGRPHLREPEAAGKLVRLVLPLTDERWCQVPMELDSLRGLRDELDSFFGPKRT
jgi:hypothetical protein